MIRAYHKFVAENGFLTKRRKEQSRYWMHETIREGIFEQVFSDPSMQKELEMLEEKISRGEITSHIAAASILNKFSHKH